MKIYDGGSNKDEIIYNSVQPPFNSDTVTSKGNQMFITFKTDGNGFTAKITFGNRIIL